MEGLWVWYSNQSKAELNVCCEKRKPRDAFYARLYEKKTNKKKTQVAVGRCEPMCEGCFSCIHSCILIACACPFPAQETLTGEEGQSDSSQVGPHSLACCRRCATSSPGETRRAQEMIAHSSFVAGRLAVTSCGAGERLRPLLGEIIASAWSRRAEAGSWRQPF